MNQNMNIYLKTQKTNIEEHKYTKIFIKRQNIF